MFALAMLAQRFAVVPDDGHQRVVVEAIVAKPDQQASDVRVGEFDAWEVDVLPDAQSGAPRRSIETGFGHAYGGMPAVPPLPKPNEEP